MKIKKMTIEFEYEEQEQEQEQSFIEKAILCAKAVHELNTIEDGFCGVMDTREEDNTWVPSCQLLESTFRDLFEDCGVSNGGKISVNYDGVKFFALLSGGGEVKDERDNRL